jgi:hypothetical protein
MKMNMNIRTYNEYIPTSFSWSIIEGKKFSTQIAIACRELNIQHNSLMRISRERGGMRKSF